MKKAHLTIEIALAALFFIYQPTYAANTIAAKPPVPSMQINTLRPLQGSILISPAIRARSVSNLEVISTNMAQIQSKFDALQAQAQYFEQGVRSMPAIRRECTEKNYSVQDQTAAGCLGSETLNQCMEKLVHHCVATYNRPGTITVNTPNGSQTTMPVGSGASTQGFIEAARQTAENAKALGQMLQQYATQAERRANSWR